MRDNLAELLGSQKLWQRVPQVLSAEAVEQLLESPLPGEPLWRRDRAAGMLYATGCRWNCSMRPAAGRRKCRS